LEYVSESRNEAGLCCRERPSSAELKWMLRGEPVGDEREMERWDAVSAPSSSSSSSSCSSRSKKERLFVGGIGKEEDMVRDCKAGL
jgi:hypothetical protein